jgi:phage gp36-like protein
MAYATLTDIIDLYGENALVVADHDRDGEPDLIAVDRALSSAAAEIDTYIAVRYPLPLTSVAPFLITVCVDIAVYRLALSHDILSEEHRTRYDDAIAFLKRVADGKAALIFSSSAPGEDGEPAAGPRPIVAGGPERLFSREKMREL